VSLPPIAGVDPADSVLVYADAQIRWYDANSRRAMVLHFRLRTVQLASAALIPVTQIPATGVAWRLAAAVLGGAVAVLQGIDSLHHYGEHYVAWRATCQKMLRERQLFSAGAGPYGPPPSGAGKDLTTLASRLDAIEGNEQQSWQEGQIKEQPAANPAK
jgi:hypothetical protein